MDPSTGACTGGDSPANCQFGNLGRNALRGPDFVWSDLYLTKWFQLTEHVKLRIDGQFFNVFNHPNFGLPNVVYAGIPGKPSTQTGFGAFSYPTSPPTGLVGSWIRRRQFAAHDRVSSAIGVLRPWEKERGRTRNRSPQIMDTRRYRAAADIMDRGHHIATSRQRLLL